MEEKKNTMENMTEKDLAIKMANRALDVPNADPDSDICTISRQFLRALEFTASGSVAAPKEEKSEDFGKLKWKVGQILAEQFLKYNDGKFIAAIELNPATHALTEFIESENTALREALKELLPIAENAAYFAGFLPQFTESELEQYESKSKAIIERAVNL